MENINLDFECTHNTAEKVMTCIWNDGRVQLEYHFNYSKSVVLIDGEIKSVTVGLTIDQFIGLQWECQEIADKM